MAFNNVYRGKKVLITGNTGFKGSWLSAWLLMLGAEVYGYSNSIPTQPSMFEVVGLPDRIHHHYGDIRNKEEMSDYVQAESLTLSFILLHRPLFLLPTRSLLIPSLPMW